MSNNFMETVGTYKNSIERAGTHKNSLAANLLPFHNNMYLQDAVSLSFNLNCTVESSLYSFTC